MRHYIEMSQAVDLMFPLPYFYETPPYVSTSRSKTLIAKVLPSHPLQCIGCCQLCNRFIYNIYVCYTYDEVSDLVFNAVKLC